MANYAGARWSFRWYGIGFCMVIAVVFQWSHQASQLTQTAEHFVTDRAKKMLASSDSEQRIVIVDIDESSLAMQGAWPWPRDLVADLVESLIVEYGSKSVGLDVVFPASLSDSKSGDERLAALGQYAPVVFAQAFDFSERDQPLRAGHAVSVDRSVLSIVLDGPSRVATGFVGNHAGLSSVRCVGNIGISPDNDGLIRRVPLQVEWQKQLSLLLPLAMIDCVNRMGGNSSSSAERRRLDRLPAGNWEVPYSRQWDAYTVVSAHDILTGAVPVDKVRNRWVFVGSSALGLNDRAATPLSSMVAGVMVHAAVMTALLDWKDGRPSAGPLDGQWAATLWIVVTLSLLGVTMCRYKAWILLPLILFLCCAWLVLVLFGTQYQLRFSAASPLLAYALVMFMLPIEWWMLQREQGAVLRSFATYVAPAVLQQMLQQGISEPMVPQHRQITVLSADMQNYTGLTNQCTLEEAATLTREFLQCLTAPILTHGGTLDKYTGDGLVAFWGAPVPTDDHTVRALDAGRQMLLAVRRWNEGRIALGLSPARVRIGIESGPALVGDLGTEFRRTYTAVGDCINLASKLQAAARHRSVDIVIGNQAAQSLQAAGVSLVFLAEETLPGKNMSLMLWTMNDLVDSVPPAMPPNVQAGAFSGP